MHSMIILGRQPALGLAELESLYGADNLRPIASNVVLVNKDAAHIPFARLGGSVKLTRILSRIPATSWREIEKHLHDIVPEYISFMPTGKIRFGISTFGIKVNARELNATGLRLKKLIKAKGRSVRIIPNKTTELNSAQVLHNQLIGPTGWELVLVRFGQDTLVAQTVAEQDIEAYSKRDQARPMRDAKVGMLPPKLAQIIINLALPIIPDPPEITRAHEEDGENDGIDRYSVPAAEELAGLLDPFCGTGVLLQEAILMGISVIGSDINERMVQYTQKNLGWLYQNFKPKTPVTYLVFPGDATTTTWQIPILAVACETYLGKPLTSLPAPHILHQIIAECNDIHEKFLRNIGSQIPAGIRLCLAVPAWKTKNGFLHLKTLDLLEELGYTRQKFVHARSEDLIYHRPDQTTARELVVLVKK